MARPGLRGVVVAAAVAVAIALLVAWALPGPRGGVPPARIWTTSPPAAPPTTPGTNLTAADARDAPDGRRLRGWDARWSARFGPVGGPQFLWSPVVFESADGVEALLARFRGADEEAVFAQYAAADAVEIRDGVRWQAWDRASVHGGSGEDR